MHVLPPLKGHLEDRPSGRGHAPDLDRGYECGLMKKQSQHCLGHEYVLEGSGTVNGTCTWLQEEASG